MPCHTPLGDHNQQLALQLELHLREMRGEKLGSRAYSQLDYDSLSQSTRHIDRDTRTLCEWCKAHPDRMDQMSLEFQEWWAVHQVRDRFRKRKENL